VQRLPSAVRLTFSEQVETSFGAVRVFNDRGLRVDRGAVHAARQTITVRLATALAPGTYVVHWRAVGRDGHPATDSFVFHYRKATRAGLIVRTTDRTTVPRDALRAGALLALAVLWARALLVGGRRRGLVGVTLIAVGALLVADAMGLSGLGLTDAVHPTVLRPVLETTTGTVRAIQLGLVALALAWPPLAALTAGVALAAEAWAGHATGAIAVTSQAVHVLAMGLWLGGLVVVVRNRGVLNRYRPVAATAVVVLVATGAVNASVQLGQWSRLLSTMYGRLLLVKIILVALVLVVAWVNRKRARLVGLEMLGQVAILGLAVTLAGSTPARVGAGPVSRVFELGPWRASFVVDPDQTGANEVHLFLLSGPGQLAADVDTAVATVTPADGGGGADFRLLEQGGGHYVSETAALRHAGRWVASIAVTGKDGRHYAHRIPFVVSP
jgi:copper transport protein